MYHMEKIRTSVQEGIENRHKKKTLRFCIETSIRFWHQLILQNEVEGIIFELAKDMKQYPHDSIFNYSGSELLTIKRRERKTSNSF